MKEILELAEDTAVDTCFKDDAAKIPDFKIPSQNDTEWEIKNDALIEDKQLDSTDSAKIPDFKIPPQNDNEWEIKNDALIEGKLFDSADLTKILDFSGITKSIDATDNDNKVEIITTINERYEGGEHPETKVPFERQRVTLPSGEVKEGVFPVFESEFDAQLSDALLEASDKEQANESNKQLKDWVKNNPEEAKEKFTEEQLEDINKSRTPEGYTWHHNEEPGKMQLVDSETHAKTGHTGGKSIWGGGSDNR